MKRLYSAFICACALLLIGTCVPAYAGLPGSSCSDAIPMGKNYEARVEKGQTIWYSAWTFDLPLTVTFAPDNGESDPAPEVEMDFTCLPGYYKDSILCSLFCKTSGSSGIDMGLPHKPKLSSGTKDGKFYYYLSLGKRYRDLMLQAGISYNVEAYVKVTYKSNGVLSLQPDNLFTNCVDSARFMKYGDTEHFAAYDTLRHIIVPYLQWQEDTIYYKWTGSAPCEVVVANTCDFLGYDHNNGDIIEREKIAPGDSAKVTAKDLYTWVHDARYPNEAGMYFAKVYSAAPGNLKVIKAAPAPLEKDAILLRYDKSYPIEANSKGIYAIPRSWNVDVQFNAPTEHVFSIVFAKSADFGPSDTLLTCPLKKSETGRWVGLTSTDMTDMWKKMPGDKNYIYIRFICTEATVVTPERWFVSECFKKTQNLLVSPGEPFTILRTSSQIYRFIYSQWKGGDMTIEPAFSSECEIYLADTCGMTRSKSDASYWLKYQETADNSTPLVIPAAEIASWADRIDAEGHFYALFYTTHSGARQLTVTTTVPQEDTDPEYPMTTISVACDDAKKPFVQVSKTQTVIIKDESGAVVKTIEDAEPDKKYDLSDLSAGKYTLTGEKDEIVLNL